MLPETGMYIHQRSMYKIKWNAAAHIILKLKSAVGEYRSSEVEQLNPISLQIQINAMKP